ncbi:MAG: hypothetical protein EBX36_06865 [Planctomycetia bacterium]|nr:hypothetical protein [Planctomycetia bacterium]
MKMLSPNVNLLRLAALAVVLASVASPAFAEPPSGVPEIDPGSMGSAAALLFGSLALIGRSRSR